MFLWTNLLESVVNKIKEGLNYLHVDCKLDGKDGPYDEVITNKYFDICISEYGDGVNVEFAALDENREEYGLFYGDLLYASINTTGFPYRYKNIGKLNNNQRNAFKTLCEILGAVALNENEVILFNGVKNVMNLISYENMIKSFESFDEYFKMGINSKVN